MTFQPGYHPPKEWKKGQSGNPKGRPRRSEPYQKVLNEELTPEVMRGVIRKMIDFAMVGNPLAWGLLIKLSMGTEPSLLLQFFEDVKEEVADLKADKDARIAELERKLSDALRGDAGNPGVATAGRPAGLLPGSTGDSPPVVPGAGNQPGPVATKDNGEQLF